MIQNKRGRLVPWWAPGANIMLGLLAYGLTIWIGLEYGLGAGLVAAVAVSLRAASIDVYDRYVR